MMNGSFALTLVVLLFCVQSATSSLVLTSPLTYFSRTTSGGPKIGIRTAARRHYAGGILVASSRRRRRRPAGPFVVTSTTLSAAKGFGSGNPEPKKNKKKKNKTKQQQDVVVEPEKPTAVVTTTATKEEAEEQPSQRQKAAEREEEQQEQPTKKQSKLNQGQLALERMRRERAEKKDAELRAVRELLRSDEQVQETPAAIPERVANRMGARMLPFVGIPLFLALFSFVAFWYLATYQNLEIEPSVVAATTIGLLVVGLLGITYSLMSASWDPDRETGSALGAEEFKKNVDSVKEGLKRSRENAILRDKVRGLSQDELSSALSDLERREKQKQQQKKQKRQQSSSLESKLHDELDD